MQFNIDKETGIPLFAALSAVPCIVGVVLWIGALGTRVDANEARLERVVVALREDRRNFSEYADKQLKLSRETRDIVIETRTKVGILLKEK